MLAALSRSTTLRIAVSLVLLATPFVIVSLTDKLGNRRGVWVALIGAVLAMVAERPFMPYNVTWKKWMGRGHWMEIAILLGLAMGLILSIADGLGQGIGFWDMMWDLWIPLYRSTLFAVGFMLLRRTIWERMKTVRARSKARADAMAGVPITPALPRQPRASRRREAH